MRETQLSIANQPFDSVCVDIGGGPPGSVRILGASRKCRSRPLAKGLCGGSIFASDKRSKAAVQPPRVNTVTAVGSYKDATGLQRVLSESWNGTG